MERKSMSEIMSDTQEFEPGVMLWAERDNISLIADLGVRHAQLGIPGGMDLTETAAGEWKRALAEAGATVVTVFAAYEGEDYADIPTVQRTVGFIPPATRAEREARTLAVSDFAARLGVKSIACHIGFVPEDPDDPDYIAVRAMVRRVCDRAASHGQTFALETGQEPASVLLRFIADVARANLRINFDPANLILYGTGEPIAALRELAPLVVSVHCKDGDWPPAGVPGALGTERPLGEGSVGIARFVETLRELGFRGPLNVEREAEDQRQRLRDLAHGVELLRSLIDQTASAR
jgi:sugar phosphate isomerase/epimerase